MYSAANAEAREIIDYLRMSFVWSALGVMLTVVVLLQQAN